MIFSPDGRMMVLVTGLDAQSASAWKSNRQSRSHFQARVIFHSPSSQAVAGRALVEGLLDVACGTSGRYARRVRCPAFRLRSAHLGRPSGSAPLA
ncbi:MULTISPECIES: hypothetical protein [Burkholderia]|uniref:hypothetical protein n=1 Tax=Burkholderia TaxID=32008 RepID=UPI0027DC6A4E|nr:hypothetical protein [Burkholderia sp. LMG 13014]